MPPKMLRIIIKWTFRLRNPSSFLQPADCVVKSGVEKVPHHPQRFYYLYFPYESVYFQILANTEYYEF